MIDLMALLELYNTYSHDDIFYEIARNVLAQYNHLKLDSLGDLADSLHVSSSSMSRFLKQIYYENFTTFRQEHLKREEYYLFDHARLATRGVPADSLERFSTSFLEELSGMLATVEQDRADALLRKLRERSNIIFVGIPMPSEVWWLQMELILLGKRTSAFLDPNCQAEAIETCGPGDLVVAVDFVRQDDIFLDRALEIARERGADTACISHAVRPGLTEQAQLTLSYGGTNTRTDQFALSMLLNYLGYALRR